MADASNSPSATISSIAIVDVPAVRVLSLRRTIESYRVQGALWQALFAYTTARNIASAGARFMVLRRPATSCSSASASDSIDLEVCLPISETAVHVSSEICSNDACSDISERVVPALARAAVVTLVGPYSELPRAHSALHEWMREQSAVAAGPVREVYRHADYANDPAGLQFVTELVMPL